MEANKKPRCKQKVMLPETLALRKMREILNLDRKSAAILVEKSSKQLEKIENGFVELTPLLISKFIKSYGFSVANFELLVAGKVGQVCQKLRTPKKRIIENNSLRRSYKKIITKEAETLKALRRLRGLSQYQASHLCRYHRTAIGHIENGRVELPRLRIQHIVQSYGFTMDDFEYHMKAEVLVTEIQEECISIIKGLCEKNLKAVHPLLLNFKS